MNNKIRAVCLGFGAVLVAGLVLLLMRAHRVAQPILVSFTGITNGTIGLTNGRWAMYTVTNRTTNTFWLVGAKIELRRSNGWELDPTLERTDLGSWRPPPTRAWHDAKLPRLGVGGSFHYFFREREDATPWRASLRFMEDGPWPTPSSKTAVLDIVKEEAEGRVNSMLHPLKKYDCPVPEPVR